MAFRPLLPGILSSGAATGAWDISNATFVQEFSVFPGASTISGMFFKPDGTAVYMTDIFGDEVNVFSLSTPWDISSAVFSQSFSVSAQDDSPHGIFVKPDGAKMYVAGSTGDAIHEYAMSTSWDVSSASFTQSFSTSAQSTNPRGLFFKPDGTKMYVADYFAADAIFEYTLSTAWDVSSASFLRSFFVTGPNGIFFRSDGLKMYIGGANASWVKEYDLATAWDVSSAVFVQEFLESGTNAYNISGVFFKPDGTRMFTGNTDTLAIREYALT